MLTVGFVLAGHPRVTVAPNWESGSTMSESPLSVLSQTLLDQQARDFLLIENTRVIVVVRWQLTIEKLAKAQHFFFCRMYCT